MVVTQITQRKEAMTVQKCVAITLQKLASLDCYRSVDNQFTVVKSVIGAVVMEVCKGSSAGVADPLGWKNWKYP